MKANESIIERLNKKVYGCIIGGAIGDALGWPVEFLSNYEIKNEYGENGIVDLVIGEKGKAEITDDTQMTLFTAFGIFVSAAGGIASYPIKYIYDSYLDWLFTQEEEFSYNSEFTNYLLDVKELFQRRAPGCACISSLKSGVMGIIENPINDSKGCGGVMRVAPVGLIYESKTAFKIACECAAITHGHPSGYISAGILACIIAEIMSGKKLDSAIKVALEISKGYIGYEECYVKVTRALELSKESIDSTIAINELGEGWTGEEALAIAIYCALKYRNNFKKAVICSVNHDGDSDSTGAITGNILGAYLGVNKIPKEWIEKIELFDTLDDISNEICNCIDEYKKIDYMSQKSEGNKTLSKTSRELIIFHIFQSSTVVEFNEVLTLINSIKETSKKTIMRDVKNLQDAGIINVRFSRRENGYIHEDIKNTCPFLSPASSNNKAQNRSLEKLNRLGTIMVELKNPNYQKNCVIWYKKKFPNVSNRTMWRDFKELSYIGYKIKYDNYQQCYVIDFPDEIESLQCRIKNKDENE